MFDEHQGSAGATGSGFSEREMAYEPKPSPEEMPAGRDVIRLSEEEVAAPVTPKAAAKRKLSLKTILPVLLLAAAGGGVYYGYYWWTVGRFMVTTDDAYVGAVNATLSPKVSGYVSEIAVADNQRVVEGQVIARIDDGDYKLAVQSARDQIAIQEATVSRLTKQLAANSAAIEQANAQRDSAKAGAVRAGLELKRQQDLAALKANTQQTLESAKAAADQADAAVKAADANIDAAEANLQVTIAQQEEAKRVLDQYRTALAKAERDLSFTVIRAPFDGIVGNRAMQVGDYVQPTQRLASLVPIHAVYVDANFKETQMAGLKPGQPVAISVDAYPDHAIEGKIASVAPASGSVFSLLPPDNATGNFTKIVQRLPVRILVPQAVAEQQILRPGMSVIVSVNTKPDAAVTSEALASASVRAASKE